MKPKTKKSIVLFAALALVLGFAAAELQKSVRVVVSTGTAKGQPDVAYDAQAERYLVVWQERAGSGDDRDIRARVVNRDGTPASDIVALASSGEDERLPKTAATGSSSWTVVWSTGTSIEACTVDATGKATDFRTVDATPARPVDRPDIGACSSDGAFLVVWEELDETGLTVIKGRRIHASSVTSGEEFLLARSPEHDLRNPSVSKSGSGSFVAWEKPVELRRADIEGRFVPADAASSLDLGQVLTIAADGARNTVPSVTAYPETDAYLVVWQSSDGRRASDISFASVTSLEVQSSGKLTDTPDFRETRPFASSVGIAGRALITYQTAPSNTPLQREIAARTIGWGDAAASAEIVLDPTREGGGNPAAVPASGAGGRGLVVWDVKEGEGSNIYSREWLASELTDDGLLPDIDGPIVPLADVTVSGVILFNGLPQAGVLLSGFPIETRTDATGAYSGVVAAPWDGTVTPVQPGFTFSPPSNTYADVNADVTGQNYTATYVGGAEDSHEDNEDFSTAVELPLGTTHDLVLNDVDWFKFLVPASEAGKDLRIRLRGTGFPDTVNRRDLDFAILDASGKLLHYNVSGGSDETAYICDAVEGYYYIVQTYIPIPAGIVYSVTAELSDTFGLSYITGHVTDNYGMPLEGIVVELYDVLPDWWTASHPLITTDADGYYKFGWVPGNYTLRFNTYDFGNDGFDWTPDENYIGEMYNYGEVITLAPGSTVTDIDAELRPGGTITGTIVDGSGDPVNNARVYVFTSSVGSPGNVLTDGTGTYLIDRIWAGNYALRLRTTVGPIFNEWYDDRIQFASADPVEVSPEIGATAGVDAKFEERNWGTITGRVTNMSENPVGGLRVAIVDPAGVSLWTVQTDPQGYYTLSRVPAGAWKIFFDTRSIPATSLVPVYFPGTPLISDAQTVQVHEGELIAGIDAVLPQAGNISGQILNNIGGVNVIAYDTASEYSWSVSANVTLTGAPVYTIPCLPPGTYKVLARPNQQGDRLPQWHPAAASFAAASPVTVTAGGMTSGIDITLAGGGALIQGQVTDIDGFGLAGVNVVAYDPSKRIGYASALSDEDGNYTIRQVPAVATPSSVKIHFNTDSYWLNYIAEYYNNRSDYNVADTVAVTNGETVTLLDAVLDYRPEFAVTTASLPDGEVAVAYSHQLMATGGRTFYHWSIQTGTLPDGLSLGANGLIMGTPTSTGVWPFTIEVSDSTLPERQSVIQAMTITIGAYTGEGYTISGTVTQGGSPLPGVVLDELPGDPVTSSTGTYVAVVEPGFWNIVTPVLAGYAFDPPFREYTVVTGNLSGQDYAASPGYRLSGTVTIGGAPLSGVRITGLPTEIRTDEFGNYSIMLPIGWGGTVIPVLSGFTFSPTYMNYAQLLEDTPAQDYFATYAGGGEDIYEDNDTFATAATVAVGVVIPDLVLNDQDWFKFEVPPGDAGKTLGVRLRATAFPNGTAVSDPAHSKDLDYGIMDETGRLLTYSMSGSIDEVTFIPDIQPGWYTIGHTYMVNPGMVYSLYVTTAELLPVGKVTGRVTNEDGQGIEGITVQLFKLPFDWNDSHAMAITDAEGFYKAAAFSGDYQVKVGLQDFDQNPNDGLPDGWVPVRNYLPNSYDHDKTVILDDGAPISADVTLEWAGAISGRITDEEGNPIQSARINAYLAGGIQASVAYTDADGNYEIRHLRPANYALQFRPPAGSPLAREWYNDVSVMGASLPVPAVAETTTMSIDAVLETGGQISGYVRNEAGDPIQGVTAVALDPSGIAMQAANSQSDGSYFLNSLKEGSYKIVFNPANCYAGNFLFREYNSGEPVPVADGQTTSGIDGVMYPAGTIIGRLSDQDDNGLMNGSVQAFSASTGNMWAATIDYMGNYTIRNLPPDNYRIRFSYTFGSITNYPPKWYSNANSGTEAAVLTVSAGGTVNGINGVLGADGGGISGRVTNTVGGGIAGISVLAEDGSFGEFATSQALTDAFGYYTVQNVPTGTARVFFQPGIRPFNAEFYNDQTGYGSAAAVPIEQDNIQTEINAELTVRPSLALATTSLLNGELGAAYAQTLAASGGFAFYHWSINSGSLPPGLAMNSRGEISGTPTMQGTFSFMVDLTDSSYPQQFWTSELSITVGEYTGLGYTVSGTVTADATPLAGVTMSGLPGSPVTNPAGGYVAVVPSGWNGTVRPVRAGYAFTPATITYANVSADSAAQDYTAVAGFTISGTVMLGGIGQAGVVMAGLPGTPSTDAAGGYAVTVPSGWDGVVTPTLPGFTFAPASIPFTDVSADMTGQNFVSTYAGGVDDSFEDNESFETAAVVPLGTTSGLVLRDEDWFKVLIPAEDAGKDLRVHIWGTSYPDQAIRRDIDFGILDAAGDALSFSLSGSPDETAYICDIAAGWYYIAHQYIGLEGTVYSLAVDTNDDFGLAYISGTVRDDGDIPLPGVNVELYGVPFNWDVSRPLVVTDASGNYKIGWAPGAYQVEFNITDWSRAGTYDWLPDANYLGEAYNGGEVLTLTAGATLDDIDGQLTPGGAITGTVRDSSGNPFLNAWVYAYGGDAVVASYSLTNGDGHYVVSRLKTGNYAMRFRPTGDIPHATEWYDDAASFAEGMPIAVVAGATTGGIDATFGTPGSFSGRVTNELGDPIAGVQVTAYDPAGIALASVNTLPNGNYGVGRLPSGSFRVLFNAAPATTGNFVSEYYADQRYLSDGTDVEVTAGATTVGIDAVLALAGTISGQVTVAGGAGLSNVSVHAVDVDSDLAFSATSDALGNYTIINLPAANYKVRFRPNTGDWAVEWWGDKTNFTEADIVTVASGATVSEIDAEITEQSGWITGRVTNGLGAGIAGLTVVAQDAGREAAYNSAITDGSGNYYINRFPTCQTKLYFNADTAHLNYVSEYHLDKADHASADAVNVTVGETMPIIDAVLADRPALTVTTDLLPSGELAVGYSATLAASGGRTLYHWSLISDSLPDGLTMNARGEISGMPTMAGTFWFTVRVSDSTVPQQVTTKDLSITVGEYTGVGYTISGRITFEGNPLAGVVLTDLPGSPTTNSSGGYAAVVPEAWAGTVTPTLAGYVFDPIDRVYTGVSSNFSGQDYTATAGIAIFGNVTLGEAVLSGVLMSGFPNNPVTGVYGDYRGIVPVGWSGTATPTLEGYTFTPATRTYTNVLANFAGQDYAATAVVPRTAKVDFNGDGQEDILWRYYGAGDYQGLNVVWLMNQTGGASSETLPLSPASTGKMNLLAGRTTDVTPPDSIVTGTSRTQAPKPNVKSVLSGRKQLKSARAKMRIGSPMDAGLRTTAKGRRALTPQKFSNVLSRKDAAAPEVMNSGTAEIASLNLAQEIVFSQIPDTGWEIAGTGDFNGDTKTDILWRYYGTGGYQGLNDIWFMDGTTFVGENVFSQIPDTNWRIAGTGDFNGDGDTDILWRYYGTGAYQGLNVIWYMNGAQFAGETVFSQVLDTNWRIEGTGDFNSDGQTDILWRFYGTGDYQGLNDIWFMNGSTFVNESVFSQIMDTAWQICGTGDFNGDGQLDILWRYYGTAAYQGLNDIWYMNGTVFVSEEVFSLIPDINWRIVNR